MTENFIDHSPQFDPEASMKDIENTSLGKQYSTLTDYEKKLVFAKIKGYRMIPCPVLQFISDEYYLGGEKFFNHGQSVFDFWKDTLDNEIFQGEFFTKKPYVILSGAIGIGKSTITRICLAICLLRLLCMKNPYKTLGIVPKPLTFLIAHRKEESALVEFKNWLLKDVLFFSPFFHNVKPNFQYKVVTSGPLGSMGIGNDLIFSTLGELSFWPNQESAKEKAVSTIIRFKSRFSTDQLKLVGQFIVDSSARSTTDATPWILENVDRSNVFTCSPAHYEVRPGMYKESGGKTFRVFTGDGGSTPPQIIPSDMILDPTKFDPAKVIKVPIQLLGEYKANLIKSLQDLSGISTGSNDLFFGGDISKIKECSSIINRIPEVITVDFYDKNQHIYDIIQPQIALLPPRSKIFVGLDLSAARGGDATGISISTFDGWRTEGGVKVPQITVHAIVAIKNKEGQEISLYHIEQLIDDLNKRFIPTVSADAAFSKGILQHCTRENIRTYGRISTDLVPCEPALTLKNYIYNGYVRFVVNNRFQREAADLYYTPKGKIDHPKKASTILDNKDGTEKGSKDLWDAVCQSVYSIKLYLYEDNTYEDGFEKELQLVTKMTEKNARQKSIEVVQDMVENIFG